MHALTRASHSIESACRSSISRATVCGRGSYEGNGVRLDSKSNASETIGACSTSGLAYGASRLQSPALLMMLFAADSCLLDQLAQDWSRTTSWTRLERSVRPNYEGDPHTIAALDPRHED